MKNTDKDYIFIQFICVNPVHLRLNSLKLLPIPPVLGVPSGQEMRGAPATIQPEHFHKSSCAAVHLTGNVRRLFFNQPRCLGKGAEDEDANGDGNRLGAVGLRGEVGCN